MGEFGRAADLYFGGDMNAALALSGQVAGRIDRVKPVAEILRETAEGFFEVMERVYGQYVGEGELD
jgi:enoyl-[acyl-carrier protein] reductase II